MTALVSNSVAVGTSATRLFDGLHGWVTVSASATAYIGGSNVSSTGGGCPMAATTPVTLYLDGEAVYGAGASTPTIGWVASGSQ